MQRYSLPELKQMMRDNQLKGWSTKNKPEILKLLHEKGLVSDEALVKPVKVISPNYEFAKCKRLNPKKITIIDLNTGVETEYPSVYRASKTIGVAPTTIARCYGKTLKGKYEIKLTS